MGHDLGVSKNNGSILIGFSIINHPFWGTPVFGSTHLTRAFVLNSSLFLFFDTFCVCFCLIC